MKLVNRLDNVIKKDKKINPQYMKDILKSDLYYLLNKNNLNEQIDIYNLDLKEAHKTLGTSSYNVVTCNPPYFKYKEGSNINESIHQTIARHEIYATLDDVVKEANILLKDGGTFAMVHRAERLEDIILTFSKYNFAIKRLRFVYPKTTESYWRIFTQHYLMRLILAQ